MTKVSAYVLVLAVWLFGCELSDVLVQRSVARKVQEGNALYLRGELNEALIRYRDAETDAPEEGRIKFNIGNVFYRQAQFGEAEETYLDAARRGDAVSRADAWYNLGNACFKQGRFDKAVESYQKALEFNPSDRDAKFNLELVQKMLNRAASEAASTPAGYRRPSNWARDRMKEAEALAQRGKYGEAQRVISRTFQAEPSCVGEFGEFAERVNALKAIFGEGR
ncbi:MAG TPA: tetratricopeptide repeat protein [Candidatus Latescibacteria bacterium]|nr:tetratricopeptide repeat protein [Candidatus Latescibacterota bacterium]HOF61081.1 tetratricopeptide repeat protein [Candidatus Latescibacterota bacterium]HOM56232.1 tetratricopeptide repeat protein [Candidatus Latescibacterota bacterium]HOS64960.1 tetratricopeptide repeat protein [Candidatus Latescibacterota bacterium]HPK74134.1 tetratricopeptide repeat protein [Candidatus Latescibacterota bacterium]